MAHLQPVSTGFCLQAQIFKSQICEKRWLQQDLILQLNLNSRTQTPWLTWTASSFSRIPLERCTFLKMQQMKQTLEELLRFHRSSIELWASMKINPVEISSTIQQTRVMLRTTLRWRDRNPRLQFQEITVVELAIKTHWQMCVISLEVMGMHSLRMARMIRREWISRVIVKQTFKIHEPTLISTPLLLSKNRHQCLFSKYPCTNRCNKEIVRCEPMSGWKTRISFSKKKYLNRKKKSSSCVSTSEISLSRRKTRSWPQVSKTLL